MALESDTCGFIYCMCLPLCILHFFSTDWIADFELSVWPPRMKVTFPCFLVANSSIQCDESEMVYVWNLLLELKSGGIFFSSLLSASWNVFMKAGIQAAILIPATRSHFWDGAMERWKAWVSEDFVECYVWLRLPMMGFYKKDFYMRLSLR